MYIYIYIYIYITTGFRQNGKEATNQSRKNSFYSGELVACINIVQLCC